MDITQLILEDHQEQRRLFSLIEQIDDADTASLAALWGRLSTFLEVHAAAEELYFYPVLLEVGERTPGPGAEEETLDAIKDHNEIRDAIQAVALHAPGEPGWREAVGEANTANSKHMGEEEREGLTDFRRRAEVELRHDLAVRFAVYEANHVTGVTPVNRDPQAYVEARQPVD